MYYTAVETYSVEASKESYQVEREFSQPKEGKYKKRNWREVPEKEKEGKSKTDKRIKNEKEGRDEGTNWRR